MWLENAESEKLVLTEVQANKLLHDVHSASDVASQQPDIFGIALCVICFGVIVAFIITAICVIFAIDPTDIPGELWDYFTWTLPKKRKEKRAIRKYKNGDMSGLLSICCIDPKDVICRDISAQDVLNTNLSILDRHLMEDGIPVTWEERARALTKEEKYSYARRYILDWFNIHNYPYVLPDELLQALLSNEEIINAVCENCSCDLSTISAMAENGHGLAKEIMAIASKIISDRNIEGRKYTC